MSSKRKRTRAELNELKEAEVRKEAEQLAMAQKLAEVEQKMALMEQESKSNRNAADQLRGLIASGLARLDESGRIQLISRDTAESFKQIDPQSKRKGQQ